MAEFICKTQHASIQAHSAPSGISYTSLKNEPFKVDNKKDIEFFAKQKGRYEQLGVVQRVIKKVVPQDKKPSASDEEELNLDAFLKKAGLSNKSVETMKKLYGNMSNLYAEFVAKAEFPDIPARQAKALKSALDDYDDETHRS